MLCGLLASGAAGAEIHGLLIFNGDYRSGIPKLEGVKQDIPSARSIAHLMGVKDENMQLHKELTLEGMRDAFDELDRRVTPGDKVFIYYSGHGGRQYVREPEERCAESLVSVNGGFFSDAELESRLQKLSGRAQKVIAMLDSCHSGGATTRAVRNTKYTPKYWSKGGQDACSEPVNIVTRSINKATRSAGSGGKNYVYIAAAKSEEVSLDSENGGFATLAWAQCMSGEARDTDGSGGLTAEEIRVCAQQKIDAQTKGIEGVLPQHISIIGNPDLVMTLVAGKSENPQQPVMQQPAQVTQTGSPAATLLDVFNGRDDRRTVVITPNKSRLKIGNDKLGFSIRSSHPGYLYLLMAGSDGSTFDLLFPNKLDGDNLVKADQIMQFPRPNWEVVAGGPAGKDHILAIIADAPRDLASLPMTNAGPFSVVMATPDGKQGIQKVSSSAAQQNECSNEARRNLAVKKSCSDAYGAALVDIEEVE